MKLKKKKKKHAAYDAGYAKAREHVKQWGSEGAATASRRG